MIRSTSLSLSLITSLSMITSLITSPSPSQSMISILVCNITLTCPTYPFRCQWMIPIDRQWISQIPLTCHIHSIRHQILVVIAHIQRHKHNMQNTLGCIPFFPIICHIHIKNDPIRIFLPQFHIINWVVQLEYQMF